MHQILNIAAYKFVPVIDAQALAATLRDTASALALKGTILLAPEGINLFLAGSDEAVRGFLAHLREDVRFADLHAKESRSPSQPFRRLRVKLKREIIRMDHPAIRPHEARAPAVDAKTLARWLDAGHDDEGRELVMLDTRNEFEVQAGRFAGALDWHLSKFTEFPAALQRHAAELAGKTVVSYCTGGIRCEKAALLMRERGVDHVLQLDGGILQYFETVGARHFEGRCVVFDERRELDAQLAPARIPEPA
ncbi:MAG TPA: sulfurtransferase [Burkholderiaceae bacterium]|nr:sulfurtransferase [Burkholderiaceae bacterium]